LAAPFEWGGHPHASMFEERPNVSALLAICFANEVRLNVEQP
jgi:hypothetical protein